MYEKSYYLLARIRVAFPDTGRSSLYRCLAAEGAKIFSMLCYLHLFDDLRVNVRGECTRTRKNIRLEHDK